MQPMRSRMSRSEVESASTAITSDAAVMSNPVCRGVPSCFVPSPLTMWRSARSLTSSTRFQVTPCGSRPSAFPLYTWLSTMAARRLLADVPGEMQVQVLEGDHLAVAAAGRTTLDPEGGPHGGLADGDCRLAPDAGQRLTEPDRRGGLALAERRGGGRGPHEIAGAGPIRQGLHSVEADLGDARAERLEEFGPDAHLCGDVGDRAQRGLPRDLDGRR